MSRHSISNVGHLYGATQERSNSMTLEELKALLERGAITKEQFDAMCKQFGFDAEPGNGWKDAKEGETPSDDPDDDPDEKLLEKKIQQAVDRATNRLGNDNKKLKEELEKLRKEKLTAEELQKIEAEEKEKDRAEREKAVKDAENKLYAVKAIKKAGLDDGSETALDILSLVGGDDEETIDSNIKALKALVDKLVKSEVEKTFRGNGRTPAKGSAGADADNPYMPGKHFNLTKQMELERSNPKLAEQYKAAAGI